MKPYYEDKQVKIYHGDCRDILPSIDKVALVLTDPPYGIGEAAGKNNSRTNMAVAKDYGNDTWDNEPIDGDTLTKVMAAGDSLILFGGNYYALNPSTCWLIWDKLNTGDFADCEMAWTNLKGAIRRLQWQWNGMIRRGQEQRWHPTQKPLEVMKWCIQQADSKQKKEHATILDPFMGSGTTLRAAKDMGRYGIGIEREEKYCEVAAKRMSQEVLEF